MKDYENRNKTYENISRNLDRDKNINININSNIDHNIRIFLNSFKKCLLVLIFLGCIVNIIDYCYGEKGHLFKIAFDSVKEFKKTCKIYYEVFTEEKDSADKKTTTSNVNKNSSTLKNNKKDEKLILPPFKTLDGRYVYPLSLTNIRCINNETKKYEDIILNKEGAYSYPYTREYTTRHAGHKILVKALNNNVSIIINNNENWEIEGKSNSIVYTRKYRDVVEKYFIKLAGGIFYIYKNNNLFGEIELKYTNNTLTVHKFENPIRSMFLYFGGENDKEKYEQKLTYAPAVMIFDNVDISIREILLLESLRLENEKKISLEDCLPDTKVPDKGMYLGTVVLGNKMCQGVFDKNFKEYFQSFYIVNNNDKKIEKLLRSATLNEKERAYTCTDKNKINNTVLSVIKESNRLSFSDFNGKKIGNIVFSNDITVFDKYKFAYTNDEKKQISVVVKDIATKEILGCVVSNKYEDNRGYYCEIHDYVDSKWVKKGTFSIYFPGESDYKFIPMIPGLFLLEGKYSEDIIYSIFTESMIYALNN